MSQNRINQLGSMPLIISVLGAGFTSGLIPAGLLPANVLNIEQAYNLSHAEMGRIVGMCMILGGSTGGLIGGLVCGRIGAQRTLIFAFILAAASLGSVGLIDNFYAMAISLVCYFFAAGFMGAANAIAVNFFPNQQRGITLLHGVNAVGKLTGPLLASLFLYGAWRNSFVAAAMLPLLMLIPLICAHRDGDTCIGRKREGEGRPSLFFWIAVAGFGFIAGSEIAVALWVPAFAQKVKGFSAAQGNMLLSIFIAGMITGRFSASGFSHLISTSRTIAMCGVLLISVVPVLSLSDFAQTAMFLFLFGLGFSAIWPTYFAHLTKAFPEHLGLMGGAAVFSTQVGFAVCSAISGSLAEINLSYPMIFATGVMVFFIAVFFLSPLSRMKLAEQPG